MPAYLIFSYDVIDAEKYSSYVNSVGPMLLGLGAEVLVVDTEGNYLEGRGRSVNVVIRFQTEVAAREFYDSAEYAPLKAVRISASANNTCLLAREFVLPS